MAYISSIATYGIRGISPSVTAVTECMYTKIRIPCLGRTFIKNNTGLLDEYFLQMCINIPLESVYRDHLQDIIMIGEKLETTTDMFGDTYNDNYRMVYYPVAILDYNVHTIDKEVFITVGDFKYYLMNETGNIIPIDVHEDLSRSMCIQINPRRERDENNIMIADPVVVKILATSGWNKNPITAYESIAPFNVHTNEAAIIYDKDDTLLYKLTMPFLMFITPISPDGFSACNYLPRNIKMLLDKKTEFNSVEMVKLQIWPTWLEDEKKAIEYICFVIKTCIRSAITAIESVPEGTRYQLDGLSERYKSLVKFIFLHYEMVTNKVYKLNHTAMMTEEYKTLIIKDLEKYYNDISSI